MQVIVLAAGRGRRLGSNALPKCMSLLNGRPWLDWQLDAWRTVGAHEITLVTGYAAEAIPDRALIARRIHHATWAQTGPVASLHRALSVLDDTDELLVAYADCLWHPDWIRRLRGAREAIAITSDRDWLSLWAERFEDPLSDAESLSMASVDGSWQITGIGERASRVELIEGQFMGLLRFHGAGCAVLRQTLAALRPAQCDALDMTSLLQKLLAQGRRVEAITGGGAWIELDHASDLALYEQRSAQHDWSHDWRQPPRSDSGILQT